MMRGHMCCMWITQGTATDHTAVRGTPGTPPPSAPSSPLLLFISLPLAHRFPLSSLSSHSSSSSTSSSYGCASPFSSLSSSSILSPPLCWWMRGGWVGVDRPIPLPQPVCLSDYLSPVSHKHIAIRNASALVRSCSSVNTSLLVVCMVTLSASLSLSPCL